jgi:hypothetical protein
MKDLNSKFELAYLDLANKLGINSTPEGRRLSHRIWVDNAPYSIYWLISQLLVEQHPEVVISISETITSIGNITLPIILSELQNNEIKTEYTPLIYAISWLTPPQNPQITSQITSVLSTYLNSSQTNLQLAAVQLTRLLNNKDANYWLSKANENAGPTLQEEISDLLNELSITPSTFPQ